MRAAVFSPDGRTLATGYEDTLVLGEVSDPAQPRRLEALVFDGDPAYYAADVPSTAMAVAFSPSGHVLANAEDTTTSACGTSPTRATPRISRP